MNILIVNSSDKGGGAEKVCSQLNNYFNSIHHNSHLIVGKKISDNDNVLELPNPKYENVLIKAVKRLSGNMSTVNNILKYICIPNHRAKVLGREPFSYPATKKILSFTKHPIDVVHLNNLHGKYFDLRQLPKISKQVPTVVRLSDMWLFTGHCAHSIQCERWKNGCGQCPDLSLFPSIIKDRTKTNLIHKEKIYKKSNLYISAPSQWLMDKANNSILRYAMVDSRVIPTGVNLKKFKPIDKSIARANADLSTKSKIIFIYANGAQEYKYSNLKLIIDQLINKYSSKDTIELLVIGSSKESTENYSRVVVHYIPRIKEQSKYINYLQSSDLYIHIADADTYPNAIMEALACGVPVIAFLVGGISEQINSLNDNIYKSHKPTGILLKQGDINGMINGIVKLFSDDPLRKELSYNAIEHAKNNFDFDKFAASYLTWYKEILTANA